MTDTLKENGEMRPCGPVGGIELRDRPKRADSRPPIPSFNRKKPDEKMSVRPRRIRRKRGARGGLSLAKSPLLER